MIGHGPGLNPSTGKDNTKTSFVKEEERSRFTTLGNVLKTDLSKALPPPEYHDNKDCAAFKIRAEVNIRLYAP